MTQKLSPRTFVLLLLLATGAACSGGDKIVSPDLNGNTNTGPTKLNSSDSLFVINQIAGAAFTSIKTLRTITVPSLPGIGSAAPACSPTVTGNTDSNGNGIPENKFTTYTAANCTTVSNGVTTVVTGSIRVEDLGGIYGYRVTYNDFSAVATKGDSTTRLFVSGYAEYAYVNTTSARSLDHLIFTIVSGSSLGSVSLARNANVTGTFTPSGSNTIALNRALPTGTLSVAGNIVVSLVLTGNQITNGVSNQTVSIDLVTDTPLTASVTCTSDAAFDAGQLRATVSGSQTGAAVAKFVGCGSGGSTTTTPSGGKK